MNKIDVTEMIFDKKRTSGMTWANIAEIIDMSEIFTTSACLGMNSMPREKADILAKALGLPQEAAFVLAEYPYKVFSQTVPTDPCIYRFYEIMAFMVRP